MPYLTADQIRDRYPAITTTVATDEHLEDLIEEFEDIAERYTGVAYLPREVTTTVEVAGRRWVSPHFRISAVDDIEIDDVVVTGHTFADGYAIDFGTRRTGTLVVTYTHGFDTPPKAILRACYEYVRACAFSDNSSVQRDVISQSGDGFTTRYSTPDWGKERPTGYIEVDRLLNSVPRYRRPVVV